ncbi:MAG: arginine deiminase-related protein, partial [Bacteroidota bacterium]|nr:arginine deiminase-related protein [Bacteroidota bacterium]
LHKHGQLVPVAIPTVEIVGGGSVRCMLAENFLPLRH